MFWEKAKKIEFLNDLVDSQMDQINTLITANTDCQQKLKNAQALIQRAEADRDAQKRRADENYTELSLLKSQMVNASAIKKGKKP